MSLEEMLERQEPPPPEDFTLSYDELCRLFWKYKGLIVGHGRETDFWAATNDNLKIAYERLDEKDEELSLAYEQNRQYLENIQEGLLLIDPDFTILDQHSRFVKELFLTEDIAGKNFVDLIFPDAHNHRESIEQLKRFLRILFVNTAASMEMIMDVNPLKEHHMLLPTQGGLVEKVLSASFIRIPESDGSIANVMVIFQDRTNITAMERELELERKKTDSEISTIRSILRFGPQTFSEFQKEMITLLEAFERKLPAADDPAGLKQLYAQTHSLKGSARYYELQHIADAANHIEDMLSQLQEGPGGTQTIPRFELEAAVRDLRSRCENIDGILAQIGALARSDLFKKGGIRDFSDSLKRMTEKLAAELGKKVAFESRVEVASFPQAAKLRNPIIHLLRNALDHGIEDNFGRISRNKPEQGTIRFTLKAENGGYICGIEDDGGGIDVAGILNIARKRGIPVPEDAGLKHALQIACLPEFSSRQTAGEISGRGYGLHIVQQAVRELGGTMAVQTRPGIGTRFILRIPG